MARAFDPVSLDVTVELELDGDGNGWTNVTRDVRVSAGISWGGGINGSGPRDRVAEPGEAQFALDNSAHNAGEQMGWYSPGHAFARAGFDVDIGVRIGLCYGGTTKYWKYRIESITPTAGVYGERLSEVLAVDWLDEAARYKLTGLGIQLNKRSDEIFTTLYQAVTRQPANTSIATGQDTYEYALDNLRDENESALAAFQKLAQSELGQIFLKGDATDGETLVFEDRHARVGSSTNVATFRGDTSELGLDRSRDNVLDLVQVVTHMRRVDAAATTVLYSLGDAAPEVAPLGTITPFGPYRDPNQEAARVGGTEMVTPVASTDYTMNTQADGGGSDITSDFTVVASFGANGVRFTVTNNGSVTGYVTKLQVRGKGVYDYARAIMEAGTAGGNTFTLDMPYQNDANVGQGAADYLLNIYGNALTFVRDMTYWANRNDFLATQAIEREISDRIGLEEELTGLTDNVAGGSVTQGWFINAMHFELVQGTGLKVRYTLAPSDANSYWILEQVGASELDLTTRLAFA